MAVKKATTESTGIDIEPLKRGEVKIRIIGTTPLICNRMSQKARQILMVGGKRKTAAEKAAIKHDPFDEYRRSMHRLHIGPTALGLPVVAMKAAMCESALRTNGVTKRECQSLLMLPGDFALLYGTPQMRMDVVRSADINRTPDIRTRACLPVWGAEFTINFISPQLTVHNVVTLASNAGFVNGIGDYRQQKGAGSFGQFRVIGNKDKDDEWDDLVKNHARDAQLAAIESPGVATEETAELLEFYQEFKAKKDAA